MPDRPRLVHRPRFGERPQTQVAKWREGPAPAAEIAAAERVLPDDDMPRDAMREVQMENIHPVRLRLLLEVERTRSISAAARECGLGQPSASMHLRKLEATLGHRLVMRDGRGSTLTRAGGLVAPHAAQILASLDSMRRAVDALGPHGSRELTIAASHMPSVILIPPILRRLADRHPGLSIALRTVPSETAVRDVARGKVDIGVAGVVATPEPVARREIAVDELVGIAPPGLLDQRDGWTTFGQLAQHTLLLGRKTSSTRTVTEHCLARAGYQPRRVWELTCTDAITEAVKHGVGVSFVSRLLVEQELERGELIAFRISDVERMLRPIHALQHTAKELTPEASAFATLLGEAIPSSQPIAAIASSG